MIRPLSSSVKTKLMITIGPSTWDRKVLESLIQTGVSILRFNFSHADLVKAREIIDLARDIQPDIAILIDLKGPEIRLAKAENGAVTIEAGSAVRVFGFDPEKETKLVRTMPDGTVELPVVYDYVHEMRVGQDVLIDDGKLVLVIEKKDGMNLWARAVNKHVLKSNKRITFPGVNVKLDFLSPKDEEDIRFAVENKADFIALSFVREISDVIEARSLLKVLKGSSVKLISKIEHPRALENIEGICDVSDGIMVARGDLGVEMPVEKIPHTQKKIIHICKRKGKPVITATQMLDSMIENPLPTRAEVTDVANAIYDGSDCLMLSGETANGKYPLLAAEMCFKIAIDSEVHAEHNRLDFDLTMPDLSKDTGVGIQTFISRAAFHASSDLKVKALIMPSRLGFTPLNLSRMKPHCHIIAVTNTHATYQYLKLAYGIIPYYMPNMDDMPREQMIQKIVNYFHDLKFLKRDDVILVTASWPPNKSIKTNMLEIHPVSSFLDQME